jgi:hypothetical protein
MLAKQVPATIHLLHIWQHSVLDPNYFVEVPASSSFFDNVPIATREEHEVALQKRIGAFGKQAVIVPHFIIGSIADKLPAFLKPLANPLVVIGKTYTENIPDELEESVAVQLLAMKNMAFLTVPEKYQVLAALHHHCPCVTPP